MLKRLGGLERASQQSGETIKHGLLPYMLSVSAKYNADGTSGAVDARLTLNVL
jgi:hypothetical protein